VPVRYSSRRETGPALYDLENDVGERMNLAERFPAVVEGLEALAEKAREDLGDGPKAGRGVRPGGVRREPDRPGHVSP